MFWDIREMVRPSPKQTDFSAVEDWDEDKTKFKKLLVLSAKSFKPFRLFEVEPVGILATRAKEMKPGTCALSPEGSFRYTEVILPKGKYLDIAQGTKRGRVCFDDDVVIPRINERYSYSDPSLGFNDSPWMSYTPMEILTQRHAIRRSKGRVVIAGLGMGWLLTKVAQRPQVRGIVVVEKSDELIEWLLDPLLNMLPTNKDVTFICDDAYDILPDAEADVALVDIFPGYGNNYFPDCPNIKYTWVWGAGAI